MEAKKPMGDFESLNSVGASLDPKKETFYRVNLKKIMASEKNHKNKFQKALHSFAENLDSHLEQQLGKLSNREYSLFTKNIEKGSPDTKISEILSTISLTVKDLSITAAKRILTFTYSTAKLATLTIAHPLKLLKDLSSFFLDGLTKGMKDVGVLLEKAKLKTTTVMTSLASIWSRKNEGTEQVEQTDKEKMTKLEKAKGAGLRALKSSALILEGAATFIVGALLGAFNP
jgi:hypothetical protein